MAETLVINVAGLNKRFGDKHVVKDLALQVRQGEIFGFLGPNGSGKTTSIRMLCGLLTPDSGRGTCLSFDVLKESAAIKRQVGYMTQKFSLWDDLTIRENLDFVARMFGMRDRRQAVAQALEELGLTGRRDQLAGTLSGGWKQRLALASCLLHQPRLLLLDEPTAGVDPKARRDFWEEIHHLSAQGITVLVSTHYMDEAERCHRLASIAYGNLLASGTAAEVITGQHLTIWEISGPGIQGFAEALRTLPGVDQVASFGSALHVSGVDGEQLQTSLQRFAADQPLALKLVEPSLEDAFIHGITAYNVVPGLLGVILTMTMILMTGLAMTREREHGTFENLLATPATPFEVMTGKIVPYILIGLIQVTLILLASLLCGLGGVAVLFNPFGFDWRDSHVFFLLIASGVAGVVLADRR